jgi:hypothetical protein
MTAILLALIIYGQVIWESIHEGAMARLWPGGGGVARCLSNGYTLYRIPVARLELYTKQQRLCLLDRFSCVCVLHILVSVRCSLFDQHVSRRLPEQLPSVLQYPLEQSIAPEFRTSCMTTV